MTVVDIIGLGRLGRITVAVALEIGVAGAGVRVGVGVGGGAVTVAGAGGRVSVDVAGTLRTCRCSGVSGARTRGGGVGGMTSSLSLSIESTVEKMK